MLYRLNLKSGLLAVAVISVLLLCMPNLTQGRTLLLYSSDRAFLPTIERQMRSMRMAASGEPLFDQIISLNKWAMNKIDILQLEEFLDFYQPSRSLRTRSQLARKDYTNLVNLIYKAQAFVRVEVIEHEGLAEFQFLITDSLVNFDSSTFASLVNDDSRMDGFTVRLRDADLDDQIKQNLHRMFSGCNEHPILIIDTLIMADSTLSRFSGHTEVVDSCGECIHIESNRRLTIDASRSYDPDGIGNAPIFHWKQLNPDSRLASVPLSETISVKQGEPSQEILPHPERKVLIVVSVSDGINESKADTICVYSAAPPNIIVRQSENRRLYGIHPFYGIDVFVARRDVEQPCRLQILRSECSWIHDEGLTGRLCSADLPSSEWRIADRGLVTLSDSTVSSHFQIWPTLVDSTTPIAYDVTLSAVEGWRESPKVSTSLRLDYRQFRFSTTVRAGWIASGSHDPGKRGSMQRQLMLRQAIGFTFSRRSSLELGAQFGHVFDRDDDAPRQFLSGMYDLSYRVAPPFTVGIKWNSRVLGVEVSSNISSYVFSLPIEVSYACYRHPNAFEFSLGHRFEYGRKGLDRVMSGLFLGFYALFLAAS